MLLDTAGLAALVALPMKKVNDDARPTTRHTPRDPISLPQHGRRVPQSRKHVATAPADTTRTRLILALLSLTIFVTITYEILPIGLLTPIAEQLRVDERGAGLLVGAYAIVVAVGSIPLSAPVARVDARTTLLALLGVLTLKSGLFASTTALPIAVIARLIGGAAHAIIFSGAGG
jgi:MFS transporter, DHA1 family, inner membrane transport protein